MQEIYCLPILVTLGQAKAGTGEIQRWLVEHPSLVAGMKNFYHLRGVGEAQYFNNLRSRSLCDKCWTGSPTGPTLELLQNYLLVEDRGVCYGWMLMLVSEQLMCVCGNGSSIVSSYCGDNRRGLLVVSDNV